MNRWKYFLIYALDIISVFISYYLALWIRYDFSVANVDRNYIAPVLFACIATSAVMVCVYYITRLYHSVWRYASITEAYRIVVAYLIMLPVFLGFRFLFVLPISVSAMAYVFCGIACVGIRFGYRLLRYQANRRTQRSYENSQNVLIIGGGQVAREIINDINLGQHHEYKIKAVIDDNPVKWGRDLEGYRIVGGRDKIVETCEKYSIDTIIFAISKIDNKDRADILNICKETGCKLQRVPGLYDLYSGKIGVSRLKDVDIEDLLGREPIKIDLTEVFRFINGKKVLVTGGGGSIGSELCRQIAAHHPSQLIVFDIYENNAYAIQQELKKTHPDVDLVTLIGSVRDSKKIFDVFHRYKPDIVYHAAAHKHVPLMEDSPCEAIKNNAIGTYKTAYAAMMNNAERFVLISTDKAVNPTNIMGASKRLCEMIIQTFDYMISQGRENELPLLHAHMEEDDESMKPLYFRPGYHSRTRFVAVRFGNVLGSNGSVIPLFKQQIASGGPVTVTHPDIIRYFMTIPEAVSLVMEAGVMAKGSEIFVLDMGEPIKIDTLARNLIKLSGLRPDIDIKIEYTGLRPGEKLYEEKLMAEEGLMTTDNHLIHIGRPIDFDYNIFLQQLKSLMFAAYDEDEADIRSLLKETVTTYHPADERIVEKDEKYLELTGTLNLDDLYRENNQSSAE